MVKPILDVVPTFKKLLGSRSDDWIDRMSHVFTVLLLVIFAVIATTSQFVGSPIHCWYPAEFKPWYEKYAEQYCWISNTYFVSWAEILPVDVSVRTDREITYYQWVPLILAFQALLFKVPNIFWKMLQGGAGINLNKVVDMADLTQSVSFEDREKTIRHLALYLDKWLDTERSYNYGRLVQVRDKVTRFCFICSKRAGTYLTALFLTTKVLFLANVIGQFFLLNAFMATNYNMFGFEIIDYLKNDAPWKESPRFPRVTYCDFQIRQLQNIQRWTIQCVLPVNLFNEKIFIFLWFWFFVIAALACFNFFKWFYIFALKRNRVSYVRKYLTISSQLQNSFDKKLCYRFANNYLRDDGVFVLRVITKNSTDIVTVDLLQCLWKIFLDKQNKGRRSNIDSEGTINPHEKQSLTAAEEKEREAMAS